MPETITPDRRAEPLAYTVEEAAQATRLAQHQNGAGSSHLEGGSSNGQREGEVVQ